ncbi:fatty acyl-CoA reductase [Mycobacterium xenopi 3993]|nr:fatty acyl-CoA reductase [Mycobacterium xenopi 3993]
MRHTRPGCGGTGPSTSTRTGPVEATPAGRWWAGTSSSPALPAGSAGLGDRGGRTGSDGIRAGTQRRGARRTGRRDPRGRGQAYAFTCDVTDSASVEHTVKDILGRFDHVDYLVNNAGRSIRRSVANACDRLHDYERMMAVNYFGAVRMVLALLPHWRERRFGHVVNISSGGVQARSPDTARTCRARPRSTRSPTSFPPRRCRTTSRSPTSTCLWWPRR